MIQRKSQMCVASHAITLFRQPFDVEFTLVTLPGTGGGKSKFVDDKMTPTAYEYVKKKQGIIEIGDFPGKTNHLIVRSSICVHSEGLCLPISLYLAKCRAEGQHLTTVKRQKTKIQKAAIEYLQLAKITPVELMGIEELTKLAQIQDLENYNISLYDIFGQRMFSRRLQNAVGELQLLLANNTYSVLSSAKVLVNSRYFCHECAYLCMYVLYIQHV